MDTDRHSLVLTTTTIIDPFIRSDHFFWVKFLFVFSPSRRSPSINTYFELWTENEAPPDSDSVPFLLSFPLFSALFLSFIGTIWNHRRGVEEGRETERKKEGWLVIRISNCRHQDGESGKKKWLSLFVLGRRRNRWIDINFWGWKTRREAFIHMNRCTYRNGIEKREEGKIWGRKGIIVSHHSYSLLISSSVSTFCLHSGSVLTINLILSFNRTFGKGSTTLWRAEIVNREVEMVINDVKECLWFFAWKNLSLLPLFSCPFTVAKSGISRNELLLVKRDENVSFFVGKKREEDGTFSRRKKLA